MSIKKGKCINIGNGCKIADTKQIVDVPEGNDFVCPECGSDLLEVTTPPPTRKPWLIIVTGITVACIAAFFIIRAIQHNGQQRLIAEQLKIKQQKATHKADSVAKHKADSVAKHKADSVAKHKVGSIALNKDTSKKEGNDKLAGGNTGGNKNNDVTPVAPIITTANLEKSFNRLSDPNTSDATKLDIKKGILKLFTSSDDEVIPVNNEWDTNIGMTIGKYVNSISITHRAVTVVDKKSKNGKLFEIYVSEK